tara:strand:+ start:1754 stop:2134 length:381 start_codon:yes stop_codon:yes gene_type:complete
MKKTIELIDVAKSDEEILAIVLFGSAARQENFKNSDIDICLMLKPNQYPPKYLSNKKFDYLKRFDLDIQIFQQLPIYIRRRVIKEGKILFCRDEDEIYKIAFNMIQEFNDFEHIYHDYLKEVSNAG